MNLFFYLFWCEKLVSKICASILGTLYELSTAASQKALCVPISRRVSAVYGNKCVRKINQNCALLVYFPDY
jgi:hypothetical protein